MFNKAQTAIAATAAAFALALPATEPAEAARPETPDECVTDGAAGSAYRVGINCRVVDVDGHPREYIVYVPSRAPVTGPRAPVVFMFHGSTGSGEQFLRISGWREQADATGLVAVFPTGLRYRVLESGRLSTKWNGYNLASEVDLSERPRGYPESSPWPADDVGFVDAMLSDLQAELPIDRHRIYASGFSNGANFTARLAMERSTRLAAVAYSGGGLSDRARPTRPIPMYATTGTLDAHVLEKTGLTELPLDPVELLTVPLLSSGIVMHLVRSGSTAATSVRVRLGTRRPSAGPPRAAAPTERCSASRFSEGCGTTIRTSATTRPASRRRPSSGTSSGPTPCPDAEPQMANLRVQPQVIPADKQPPHGKGKHHVQQEAGRHPRGHRGHGRRPDGRGHAGPRTNRPRPV